MKIIKEKIGEFQSKEVFQYTLTNSNKLSISVITYGGIITKIMMPDRRGQLENVTVNVSTLDEIIESRPFHGAIIGRVGGRISNAQYMDGDKTIELTESENSNTLHGGLNGLDTKLWDATTKETEDFISLKLKTRLLDGEDGFPGEVEVVVTYTLNEEDELTINYEGNTNKRTLFNPTNHVYFNLSGNKDNKIDSHDLQVDADYYAPTNDDDTPTGELKSVDKTDFDLRPGNKLENIFKSNNTELQAKGGIDHPFVLNKNNKTPAATLIESESGRSLELFTNSKAVVIYTHNHVQDPVTENENTIEKHSGIALEAQQLPDAVNHKNFGSIWLEPEETFNSTTTFKFSVID